MRLWGRVVQAGSVARAHCVQQEEEEEEETKPNKFHLVVQTFGALPALLQTCAHN